ncbi:alpha-L-fucosidase [Enterococcus hirae]|uniref:alpha-L-fucosidase n=1 Tax=Enterococcus hirae TaxID=1354 RepID=UPI001A977A72|nr:alpha-L-fucosidase [Enterococcus hirae]MBO1099123.1 alpha-L-fucosidase [Enterococcus hirae]
MDISKAVQVYPSQRQMTWQAMEFYGFIHFGMNTMTDREWGLGHEDPNLFDPKELNCLEWAKTMKSAGMKGAILTCKHHDGFCLWPSAYSKHTVASSLWKDGQGDVVKEFADACRQTGLKFGIYLSPWDRTEATYGEGKSYDDFYVNQLIELLTQYGEIFEVWFDGANGEGDNGKQQVYDWDRYYEVIRRLQPQAVIAVCGPDVRWVGNEAGQTRKNEWSVVPVTLRNAEKIAKDSQQVDDGLFSQKVSSVDEDLGSRTALENYTGQLVWYPAEVNTSIRPGWFYHQNEDQKVRSSNELFELYRRSVGGNGTFLLNLPPTPAGQLADPDKKVLAELGRMIEEIKTNQPELQGELVFSSSCEVVDPVEFQIQKEQKKSSWKPAADDSTPMMTLSWQTAKTLNTLILQEDISVSQRVEGCNISYLTEEGYQPLAKIESIGYKRIIDFEKITTTQIKLEFVAYREYPTLSGLYALLVNK